MSERYHFAPDCGRVEYCLLQRPHGTIVEVCVDWSRPFRHKNEVYRTVHIELHGGQASSDTGYYSYHMHATEPHNLLTEGLIENHALQLCIRQAMKNRNKWQPSLFNIADEQAHR